MLMPKEGTMAGIEFGNYNKPIDGALTNLPDEAQIRILQQNSFANQIVLPIKIKIDIDQPHNQDHSSHQFMK
jgi:hypothetical protein